MRRTDCAALAEIERGYLSPWSTSRIGSELGYPHGITLVAEISGVAVGWCSARFIDAEGEVLKITVAPPHRRTRVGTWLMAQLICRLTQRGVVTIYLEVRASNDPAIQFYRKMGFTQVGTRRRYYRKPVEDGLLFALDGAKHAAADEKR